MTISQIVVVVLQLVMAFIVVVIVPVAVPALHAMIIMNVEEVGNIVPVALVQPIQPNVRFIVSRTISPIVVVVLQIVMGFIVMVIVQGLVVAEDLR